MEEKINSQTDEEYLGPKQRIYFENETINLLKTIGEYKANPSDKHTVYADPWAKKTYSPKEIQALAYNTYRTIEESMDKEKGTPLSTSAGALSSKSAISDGHKTPIYPTPRSGTRILSPFLEWFSDPTQSPLETRRRFSGDKDSLKVDLNRQKRHYTLRARRRKSISDERDPHIQKAANHAEAMFEVRNMNREPQEGGVVEPWQRILQRSRSAILADAPIPNERNSVRTLKRAKSIAIRSQNKWWDVWPESLIQNVTGRQSLSGRLRMFSYLDLLSKPGNSAGRKQKNLTQLTLLGAGYSIPRPDKKNGGEDSWFFLPGSENNRISAAGVADGVGEWSEYGCSPKRFSDELMRNASLCAHGIGTSVEELRKFESNPRSEIALRVLNEAFEKTRSWGASTSVVVALDKESNRMGIANLGDSAVLVMRRESRFNRMMTVCRRTREQQHFFNCPYQLSRLPQPHQYDTLVNKGMVKLYEVLKKSVTKTPDSPDMSDRYDVTVQQGDLIIIGTDGLFDNLSDQEIASIVSLVISPYESRCFVEAGLYQHLDEEFPHPAAAELPEFSDEFQYHTPPQNIAQALVEAAFHRSMDPRAKTPFTQQCRRAGLVHLGGKADDITVVAAWVD